MQYRKYSIDNKGKVLLFAALRQFQASYPREEWHESFAASTAHKFIEIKKRIVKSA